MAIINELPEGSEVLDLGAARVARAETLTTKSFIKLSAGFVQVAVEVPVAAALMIVDGDIIGAIGLLLADPADAETLIRDGLTAGDIQEITQFITGKSLGELQASAKPSGKTSKN